MKNMEERMREIELSLHNVKLLLKEKVAQLKDQVSLKISHSSEESQCCLLREKRCRQKQIINKNFE